LGKKGGKVVKRKKSKAAGVCDEPLGRRWSGEKGAGGGRTSGGRKKFNQTAPAKHVGERTSLSPGMYSKKKGRKYETEGDRMKPKKTARKGAGH